MTSCADREDGAAALSAASDQMRLDPPLPVVPIWLLALVTLSGTLAMHIFVPAMPAAAKALGSSVSAMQLSVSLYIVGLAVGQLIYGPVSDRFGRRPVLMVGLVVYTLSGIAAYFSAGVSALLVARLFQALGGCAGLVLGRAIVRDISKTEDTARKLALMNLMVVIGPGLAPIMGGALADSLGWRSIFIVLVALGAGLFILTLLRVPETALIEKSVGFRQVIGNYGGLLKSSTFLGFAIGGGCATTSMYAFIAAAPFIFTHDLHIPASQSGFYISSLVFGYWLGSMIASRLIGRISMSRLMVGANLVSVCAASGFLVMTLSGHLSVSAVVALVLCFTIGAGAASPVALTRAVSVDPKVVGSASGLYGSAQMVVGALCSGLVGLGSDPALSAALVLTGAGLISQFCFWGALRVSAGRQTFG